MAVAERIIRDLPAEFLNPPELRIVPPIQAPRPAVIEEHALLIKNLTRFVDAHGRLRDGTNRFAYIPKHGEYAQLQKERYNAQRRARYWASKDSLRAEEERQKSLSFKDKLFSKIIDENTRLINTIREAQRPKPQIAEVPQVEPKKGILSRIGWRRPLRVAVAAGLILIVDGVLNSPPVSVAVEHPTFTEPDPQLNKILVTRGSQGRPFWYLPGLDRDVDPRFSNQAFTRLAQEETLLNQYAKEDGHPAPADYYDPTDVKNTLDVITDNQRSAIKQLSSVPYSQPGLFQQKLEEARVIHGR